MKWNGENESPYKLFESKTETQANIGYDFARKLSSMQLLQ